MTGQKEERKEKEKEEKEYMKEKKETCCGTGGQTESSTTGPHGPKKVKSCRIKKMFDNPSVTIFDQL